MSSNSTPDSGPGIILSFLHLVPSSQLSFSTLQQWLHEDYIPALRSTNAITSAWLYQAANPTYNKQHLIVYQVPDISALQTPKLTSVPRTSKDNLFEGSIDQHVTFDTRVYSSVQRYQLEDHGEGAYLLILQSYILACSQHRPKWPPTNPPTRPLAHPPPRPHAAPLPPLRRNRPRHMVPRRAQPANVRAARLAPHAAVQSGFAARLCASSYGGEGKGVVVPGDS